MRVESVSNGAVEVWTEYRVGPSAAGNNAPVCQQCRLADCLLRCYSHDSCYAVDYDTSNSSCYELNSTLACSSLTPASEFIHVSTAHCGTVNVVHDACLHCCVDQSPEKSRTCTVRPSRNSARDLFFSLALTVS